LRATSTYSETVTTLNIPLDDPAAAHDGRFDTCGLEFAAAQLKSTEASDPPVANC
jgi:hypothetical protein